MELQNIDSPDISEMDMKGPDLQRHRMKKCTSQYAALFYKSITIQKKNVCTNVCQVRVGSYADCDPTDMFVLHFADRMDGRRQSGKQDILLSLPSTV